MSLETLENTVSLPLRPTTDTVKPLKSASDGSVSYLRSPAQKTAKHCEDVDDMWDNVPV